jgi:hypothetical protein
MAEPMRHHHRHHRNSCRAQNLAVAATIAEEILAVAAVIITMRCLQGAVSLPHNGKLTPQASMLLGKKLYELLRRRVASATT